MYTEKYFQVDTDFFMSMSCVFNKMPSLMLMAVNQSLLQHNLNVFHFLI